MKFSKPIFILLTATLFLAGCQKELKQPGPLSDATTNEGGGGIKVPDNFFKPTPVPGVADNINNLSNTNLTVTESGTPEPDNGDDPVVLGQQLNNPYTIANMQQAYYNLYGYTIQLSVTHLYVRFKPSATDQFSTLLDDATLELQDYPMDYQVLQEGDYYQDPSIGTEEIGWLYSVVPSGYTPPAGIQYQVIEQLHIPNNNLLLEDMAESIAGGAQYKSEKMQGGGRMITRIDKKPFVIFKLTCDEDPDQPFCDGGGGGNPPPNDPQIPRGQIQVQDIRTCNNPNTVSNVPVRQARIICKRWFKIELTYTDDQGRFVSSKKFKNKVRVIVKTENNNARVSKVRGVRLWQILFPVKKRIGVFDQGAMANIPYLFTKPNPANAHDKELPYWVATTTHNSVLEYKQYATEFGAGQPPSKFNIIVTNWGFMQDAGAAPLWKQCPFTSSDLTPVQAIIQYFLVGPVINNSGIITLANILKNQLDVIIGYNTASGDYNCRVTSARLKEFTFHELAHTSHFVQAGCDYWQTYRTRISNELSFGNPDTRPYGNGGETNAGVVSVGEMWGNHIGYLFTNRHYGNGGSFGAFPDGFTARLQGTDWQNIPGGLNCNLNALENHNPNLTGDVHRWIPQGVCYDLIDPVGETSPVIDNVSGYTTQQCFNALQSDVRTIPAFRNRFLLQVGTAQQTQINALFNENNY